MPDNGQTQPAKTASRTTSKLVTLQSQLLGCRLVEFTGHALARMKQRDVTEDDVLKALQISNRQIPGQQQPGRIRIRWQKTRRLSIDVVYEKDAKKGKLDIITVIAFTASLTRRRT